MTAEHEHAILQLARGPWQREVLYHMIHGGAAPLGALRGRAKSYSMHYDASFRALLARLRDAGYVVTVALGPRGGVHSATYTVLAQATGTGTGTNHGC